MPARKIAFILQRIYVILLKFTSSYLSGYYPCDYSSHIGRSRGHSGIGPDGAGVFGTAAYANVPTKPTNSSNALSERFMFYFLLRVCRRLASKCRPPAWCIIHTAPTF
jgi:hypothetical protein